MSISDRDDVNHRELAAIIGITAVAAMRGGRYTTRQKKRITKIVDGAKEREDAKRAARMK